MAFTILGIGTATPPHRITQADAAEWASALSLNESHRSSVRKLYHRVGVNTRHSVLLSPNDEGIPAHQTLYPRAETDADPGPRISARMQAYEQYAGPLAIDAAHKALQDANCRPSSITHLVTVSCSGFMAPGLDVALVRQLQLPSHVQRTHIGFMGCHGVLNGLRVARALSDADPEACVLLCAVELCSLHHQYQGNIDQVVANALFADGAGALVGRSLAPDLAAPKSWSVRRSASIIVPETESLMSWQIRDHGFQMGLSPQVPDVIEQKLSPWLERVLAEEGLQREEIGCWAIHPGGPRILQACGKALRLSDDDLQTSQEILAEFGNMSSPTVLFIVERLRSRASRLPCVMLAFGPGLTAEMALLT